LGHLDLSKNKIKVHDQTIKAFLAFDH